MKYSDLDILYLTKVIPDYLHDVVFLGLCELGCNVEDYPVKPSLHGMPHPSKFHSQQLLFKLPEKKLRKKNPDILIVPGLWYDTVPQGPQIWAKQVVEIYQKVQPRKVIVIDGSDKQSYLFPAIPADYDAIFKREMVERPSEIWHPISFAPVQEPFIYRSYKDRDYDVSFIASTSNDFRVKVAEHLQQKSKELGLRAYVRVAEDHIPRQDYLDILSRSRVAVSVRGMGRDCYRYWEIPSKGTVMFTEDVGLPIRNDFVGGRHCFKFKEETLDNLAKAIRDVSGLSDTFLESMVFDTLKYIAVHHTPEARAEYVLSKIGKFTAG